MNRIKMRNNKLGIYLFSAYTLIVIFVISIVFLIGYMRLSIEFKKEAYEFFPTHVLIKNAFHNYQDSNELVEIFREIPSIDEFILVNDESTTTSLVYYDKSKDLKDKIRYEKLDSYLVPILNKILMGFELGDIYDVYSKEDLTIKRIEDEGSIYLKIDHYIESDLFTGQISMYHILSKPLLMEFKVILNQCAFFLGFFFILISFKAYLTNKLIFIPLVKMKNHFSGLTKFDNIKIFTYKGPLVPEMRDSINVVNETILELQDRVRESKVFLDEMVHEIKNPAHNIKNEIELIEDSIDDEELNKDLHSVLNETDNIISLLSSIKLTYDLYYLGGSPPDSWMSPVEVIEPIFEEYQTKNPDWTFHFEYCIKQNALIWIDQGSLELMIRNLLDNAIKYSTKGSSIFIGIREEPNNQHVLIDVVNTNSSIEYNNLSKIFGKYYRTNQAKEHTVGAGIGLWIIKNITEIYDADVSVQSSKHSTGFVITFKHVKELDS